jgi:hypothetical protein
MHPRTRATLDRLEQVDWFIAVGQPVHGPFIVVRSWEEAVTSCGSLEWENLLLDAVNRYRSLVALKAPERIQNWNDINEEMKAVTFPLVRSKIARVAQEFGLPKVFEDTVQWDILSVCMEAEYADVQPPGFYASQAYWYVNGRFPCGWNGDFPDGMLIIY